MEVLIGPETRDLGGDPRVDISGLAGTFIRMERTGFIERIEPIEERTAADSCDAAKATNANTGEFPMIAAGVNSVTLMRNDAWLECQIEKKSVEALTTTKQQDHLTIVELTDGRQVEIQLSNANGSWLVSRAAEAGAKIRASEALSLKTPGKPTTTAQTGEWVHAIPLVLFAAFAVWLGVRWWRVNRKVTVGVGGDSRSARRGVDIPETRFEDVAGCAEAIEDLREIVDVLRRPERYEQLGARAPRGALLVGPPGTGKTLLARAVAGEAGVPFFQAAGSDFVEMYVGVGAKRVRALFEKARKAGGGIVFIDEIDAVGRKRSSRDTTAGEQESENTLIALLNELDGFARSNVVVLAATNRADVLDSALVRPGRLDRRVHVGLPDRLEREAILGVHLRGKPVADGVSLEAVANRTPGMSGAQLAQVCNEAALLAARAGVSVISQAELMGAVEYVSMGRARRSATVAKSDREVTAWHEAGHAVCAMRQEGADAPIAISIVPRGEAGGVTWMKGSESVIVSRQSLMARLVVALGGRAAEEELMHGEFTAGAASDLSQATEIARAMVDRFGMTGRGLAVRERSSDDSETAVEQLLADAMQRARELVREHHILLSGLVDALLECDDLDEDAIARIEAESGGVRVSSLS